MSQALIASVARSPIGRAVKGSLVDVRPDDLAAKMVEAAIGAVPQLDPTEIEDLYLGCGEPYDEQEANMARRVAMLAAPDGLPGATMNRLCSSSLQTRRGRIPGETERCRTSSSYRFPVGSGQRKLRGKYVIISKITIHVIRRFDLVPVRKTTLCFR